MAGLCDAEIYEKHAGELIRFAAALAGPSGAEDVVASAVLRAMSSQRWPEVENRRAYLFRAVMNEAWRLRRSTDRRLRRELPAFERESYEPSPSDRDLLVALQRLSVRQRAVVYLTYWVDLAAVDVASMLGISQRSVQRELTEARRRIEELLS